MAVTTAKVKRPSAKWTGVIEFPQLGLVIDGGLYSVTRKGRTLIPVLHIHIACQSRLAAEVPQEKAEAPETGAGDEAVEKSEPAQTQVALQARCPTCNRFLRMDEVGRAVVAEGIGLIQITDEEYAGLKPVKEKRVYVRLVRDVGDVLATIGQGRRFYFLPKTQSVADYYRVFSVLHATARAGFLQDLLVDKRAYVVVIRPIVTHPSVFGQAQKLLVVDEFLDTDTLRDPREFQLLPGEEPASNPASVAALIAAAQAVTDTVSPDACVNPERRRFKELVNRKISARRVL